MNAYGNAVNSTPILAAHHISSSQNSLQGALKNGPGPVQRASSTNSKSPNVGSAVALIDLSTGSEHLPNATLDRDMQRQLEDYNRSITIIVWYKPGTEPIRLQHMNSTFPYFQLLQLPSLTSDLGLNPGSYLDTFDPQSGKWEQHSMSTVRIVSTQQRVLYKMRRNLLEGISEQQCPGLQDEVRLQMKGPAPATSKVNHSRTNGTAKRSAPEDSPSSASPKVHIPNDYYTSQVLPIQPSGHSTQSLDSLVHSSALGTSDALSVNDTYSYQPQLFYSPPQQTAIVPPPPPTPGPEANLPAHLTNLTGATAPPIPYHPHPPLKRWPNDYTVSELTAGFNAMDVLVRQPPDGTPVTQKAAFERVFGSRYVKSTVCRHRGVWRKAKGQLREQFEAMGQDERACWGEFVRRIEGRAPTKAAARAAGSASPPALPPAQPVMMYRPTGEMVSLHSVSKVMSSQAMQRRLDDDNTVNEPPVMASLQNPQGILRALL